MTIFTYPNVFAPVKADGTPNRPDLGQADVLVKELMNALQMALFDGLIYSTRAALYADLAHPANSWALVIGDPTSGYDGLYQKSGASGSGSWSRKGDVPGSGFIKGTDSGAGTPNAIQVTSPTIPATDGAALIVFNIFEANTGSPVTVSFNGGTALTIKTNSGNDVATGGLTANMMVAGFKSGSTFRLISDQASAAIVAAAEAAQAAAEAARDIAVAAAASVVASKYNSQAVAEAATISALTDFIEVGGLVYQRISASHPRLGAELVSNGSLASDTVWTKGAGWTISAGAASKAAGSATNLSQSIASEATPYFFSYEITAILASFFRLALGGTFTASETTIGVKTGVVVAGVGSTLLVNTSSTTVGSVDNISLKRLPADAFQSADGAWWAQPFIGARQLDFVSMFGAVADGADSLDPGAPTTVRGDWVTATSYAVNDLVWTGSPKLGYRCLEAHTSGTFATDLAAAKWVLGAFSGTDNTAAFNRMVLAHEATGLPMLVPYGKYRMLNPSTTTDSAYVSLTGQVFDLKLDGVLLIDEDGTAGKNYNLFKSSNFGAATSYRDRQMFRIVGSGGVRGRWSHKPGGNTPNARAHVLAISGYANIHLEGWFFEDIAGSFSRASDMDGVYCNNMRGERVAKGGLRFLKANDTRVTNNKLRHFGDDVIDIHAAGTAIRSRIYIAGNQTFDAESIIALGARETSVIGNQSALSKSGAIFVGGRAGSEGDNATMMIVVTGNTVTDPLMASADGSTLADNDGTQGAIVVGSVPASWQAGDYNGSSVNDPLSAAYYYNIDLDTTNVPRGGSIEVYGNPTRHTRPTATKFSDYGEGLCFHQDGWIDPAVTLAKRVPHGVSLLSDIENFRIDLNVAGFRSGAGIFFRFLATTEATRNFSFRNGRVSGTVTDCLDGMSHSFWNGAAQNINFPVHFSDFHCDLDPYHVSAARSSATGGNWNNGATEAQKNYGLRLASMRGFTVDICSFKNLWAPVYGDASKANGIYRGNVLYGVRAGQGYSSSNYGIGDMLWSNDQFDLIEVASIPSAGSGTYDVFSRVAAREGTVTLADDTATSITPPRPNGLISIVSNANAIAALFAYDVTSGVINAVGTSGSSVTLGTTALTGTTGTDARANYAAVSDGKIYIENRMGGSRGFRWKFIDG